METIELRKLMEEVNQLEVRGCGLPYRGPPLSDLCFSMLYYPIKKLNQKKLGNLKNRIKTHPNLEDTILEISDEKNNIINELMDSPVEKSSCGCSRGHARGLFNRVYNLALCKDYSIHTPNSARHELKIDRDTFKRLPQNPKKVLDAYLTFEPYLHSYCNVTNSSRTRNNQEVIRETLKVALKLQESNEYTSDIEGKVGRVISTISPIELSNRGQKLYDSIRKSQGETK